MVGNRLLARRARGHFRNSFPSGLDQRNPDRGTVRALARSHSRPDRHRLAGTCGVLWSRRLCRGDLVEPRRYGSDSRSRLRERARRRARTRHRAAAAARLGPDAADGDDGHCADAGRTRQPQWLADRRRGRPQHRNVARSGRVSHRFHRPAQRRALQLRGPVPSVRHRAAARAIALRTFARRDPREPAARGRARHFDLATHHRDLCGRRGLCRRRRGAARADHTDRFARPIRFPPLRRRHADADHRRRRLSLRRDHRRGGLHCAEGRHFRRDAGILGVLDRRPARRAGADWSRAGLRRSAGRRSADLRPALRKRARHERTGVGGARAGAPVWRPDRDGQCFLRCSARRATGADRAQRRRQDDADQSADRRRASRAKAR